MKYEFHPQALAEFAESAGYYEQCRRGLGAEFSMEIERILELIVESPERWPKISPKVRRCRLHRFPYGVLYAEENDSVKIIAVMHFKRRPGYWNARVK